MKLLYIGKNQLDNKYKSLYKSFSIECLCYTNPIKAIDNLLEIAPDFILVEKEEFPRMWKIILTSVRELYTKDECSFLLQGNLDDDEITAFKYLQGSFNFEKNIENLLIIKKYLIDRLECTNLSNIYIPFDKELCISFIKPDDYSFVNGYIIEINENKLMFQLDQKEDLTGLTKGKTINNASINLSDTVITVDLLIISVKSKVICKIVNGVEEYLNLTSSLFV